MVNVLLYVVVVLVWGSTWLAIKLQVGDVPVELSILYRFVLAGMIMFAMLLISRRLQVLTRRQHVLCFVQGSCLFCFNFYAFYTATGFVTSGLVSVIFSLATVFNAFNSWLWFKQRPSAVVLLGAVIGALGVALLFLPEISTGGSMMLVGVAWCLLGVAFFSCGNMLSKMLQAQQIRPASSNAWAMFYGVLLLLMLVEFNDVTYQLTDDWIYWAALLYLAVPGTVIGFTVYLMLVGRIGSEKAAYATVLFPVVALSLSTFYEGYQWSLEAFAGLGLVLLGNAVIFTPPAVWHSLSRWQLRRV
ncbi:DMT family transporter [Neptunomonas marina]|uniref:DMT family transporter n=1 Tax=Neptunomonas marina TaxID=1815562 RepID=A0A437Q7D1_9GAMM|nr:DMT family transporter [Neptunomonas marina]RVU30378.1 DMT family transporter [Neptunomonas marina]